MFELLCYSDRGCDCEYEGYLNKSIFRINNNKEIIIIPGKDSFYLLEISQLYEFKSNHYQIEYFSALTVNHNSW